MICQIIHFDFNPRAPCGARRGFHQIDWLRLGFQSTRPVWGATIFMHSLEPSQSKISIHAPRVGRDPAMSPAAPILQHFNPRAPCGARHGMILFSALSSKFQSTRPVWGATTISCAPCKLSRDFNPRAPCGARPAISMTADITTLISIHAPRVGRD